MWKVYFTFVDKIQVTLILSIIYVCLYVVNTNCTVRAKPGAETPGSFSKQFSALGVSSEVLSPLR